MDKQTLQHQFPSLKFQENVSLAPYTFMKVGGPASVFVEVNTVDDLFTLTSFCFQNQIPFTILGGVSNTVIPDEGLDRVVISNKTKEVKFLESAGEKTQVIADSGVITATLASQTMRNGLTGLEHFVGVPGTIGGAVYNNSHFTAHELIGNFITKVEVCTEEGKRESWSVDKLKFGYDYSVFHETKAVILRVTFELYKGDTVHIQEKMMEAAKKRASTQPIGIPSTGCMFRNPRIKNEELRIKDGHTFLVMNGSEIEIPPSAIKEVNGQTQIAAGFLIDKAGLKGTTVGGAQVSDKHATYIINLGTATAQDVDELAYNVEQKVLEVFGITLEREVFFLN